MEFIMNYDCKTLANLLFPDVTETIEDLEKIYNFIVDGTIGIIENWINNKCQEDPNNIAIFINKICMSGLSSFI